MGVYFRTGRNSGASVPWLVYLFVVLPLQILYYAVWAAAWATLVAAKALVYVAAVAAAAWRERQKRPHPGR